jgi:hypothetical protein
MRYRCCNNRRLEVIEHGAPSTNAIEFVEVLDRAAPPLAPRQRTLFVRLLRPTSTLGRDNVRITGGERIRTVEVLWCKPASPVPAEAEPGLLDAVDEPARTLVIRTESAGDFSTYTLTLVAGPNSDDPPANFDPELSSIEFSFKVECPADFDCRPSDECSPDPHARPNIDYVVKDYQGFRRAMLDRLSLLAPDWTERSPADVGVAVVELLAYAADNLSYRQDAIASEAYLATARKRVSVRRHARLVDYYLHEGCNARAFVHFEVVAPTSLPAGSRLLTATPNFPAEIFESDIERQNSLVRDAVDRGALVFETAAQSELDPAQNQLTFYTWGELGCCLPRGATRATLRDHVESLAPGAFLVFEEVLSPTTLDPADRDRTRRCVVRLTAVRSVWDPHGKLFDAVPLDAPLPVTEIEWSAADALPFPLCISVEQRPELAISVALGNIVLADHGRSIAEEELGKVPASDLRLARAAKSGSCSHPMPVSIPARFRPALADGPLTHGFSLAELLAVPASEQDSFWPAAAFSSIDPRQAVPRIRAVARYELLPPELWLPRRDLLESDGDAAEFVVEVEDDGRARLRFGDDAHGKRPNADTEFFASYRVGNGSTGNVGADAIAHVVVATSGAISSLRNPLPAAGGTDPEDMEVARRDAPHAFRRQERAVTTKDYAEAAERLPEVQRASASLRWTGSWYTAFVTADRFGGAELDAPFAARLRRHLERFRMAGYDLHVAPPRYVPLDVALHVCIESGYYASDVLAQVKRLLSSAALRDGTLGLFHPDNFSFGTPVYLSRVIAVAQSVRGVSSVRAERFQRLINPSATSLQQGVIAIGEQEVAQLANNPNFRERGRLELTTGGGA